MSAVSVQQWQWLNNSQCLVLLIYAINDHISPVSPMKHNNQQRDLHREMPSERKQAMTGSIFPADQAFVHY